MCHFCAVLFTRLRYPALPPATKTGRPEVRGPFVAGAARFPEPHGGRAVCSAGALSLPAHVQRHQGTKCPLNKGRIHTCEPNGNVKVWNTGSGAGVLAHAGRVLGVRGRRHGSRIRILSGLLWCHVIFISVPRSPVVAAFFLGGCLPALTEEGKRI